MKPNIDALLMEDNPSRMVSFSLEFRSGNRYDHSYLVPESIVLQGRQAVEEYIVSKALGDILYVELEGE